MQEVHVNPADVAAIIRATFPGWKGRKVKLVPREAVTLSGLNWDGGSRSQYRTCSLDGVPAGGSQRFEMCAPWDNPGEGQRVDIPAQACVVEHVVFCGKDLGLRVYVRPDDLAPLLPAPVSLSEHERVVLEGHAQFKASHGGRSRRDMVLRDARAFGRGPVTGRDYDAALASLKARKLVSDRNAITREGRNALAG